MGGDLGAIEEDGAVKVVGRLTDMIIRGGRNIYPREIEDVLRTHPGVQDVCVVGVPHGTLGELVCACIVPREGAVLIDDDLKSLVTDQVANYKAPDLVRMVDSFPRTASGEVRRQELAGLLRTEMSKSQ